MIWLLVGLLAGIVSGLLGVGGGVILTPVFHFGFGMSWSESVALSLLVIAIQSPVGVWRHARKGAVDWRLAGWLAVGGVFGVAAGDGLLPHVPLLALRLMFAAIMMYAAWRLLQETRRGAGEPQVGVLLMLGFGAGLVSRIVGVGGGIVTVPALALFGVAPHVAVGTSLVPVFTNAALASGATLARGLDWYAAVGIAAAAMVGSILGVRLAHQLPADRLKRVVAGALAVAALLVVVRAAA